MSLHGSRTALPTGADSYFFRQQTHNLCYAPCAPHGARPKPQARLRPPRQSSLGAMHLLPLRLACPAQDGRQARVRVGAPSRARNCEGCPSVFLWLSALIRFSLLLSQLTSNVPLDPRPEYHRVWIRPSSSGLKAFSTGGQRSSRTVSLAGSNGLLELPSSSESEKEKKEGEIVQCVVIGEIGSLLA